VSSASKARVALLCGSGRYPVLAAREMLRQGYDLVAVAPVGETDPELRAAEVRLREFPFFRLGRLIEILQEEGVGRVVMLGKLHKVRIYDRLELDDLARSIYRRLPDHRDDTILAALVEALEQNGIAVDPAPRYLQNWMAPAAPLNGLPLSPAEEADVRFGLAMARGIGALDVGQTVIVKEGAVVAVEAIEGTDQAILRAGRLAGPGTVVVKTAKPRQDFRFDVPGVGLETLRYMEAARARVLAVEAGKVLLLEREKVTALAAVLGVSIIGVEAGPA
jgi:UDP-2,3-diacylglucosamine hydrolase